MRARDTALLACEALGEEPIVTPVLAEDFTVADARDLLLGVEPDGRVLVVGHNPDFAQVVYDLTGARVDFKKGGVACVRLEGAATSCSRCCARASWSAIAPESGTRDPG